MASLNNSVNEGRANRSFSRHESEAEDDEVLMKKKVVAPPPTSS